MNYRHAYHAGNFADVVKHAVLALVLEYMKRKEAPFRVVDTHAGAGRYDLASIEAGKTGEWRDGIGRLLGPAAKPLSGDAAKCLQPYLDAVRAENAGGPPLAVYPGSPAIALRLMRAQDMLIANELHPQDCALLKAAIGKDPRAKVMAQDAWIALKALLPPKERRGVILIDPPFEEPAELDRMAEGLGQGLQRFATGVYLAWYPIKDLKSVARFHAAVAALRCPKLLHAELMVERPDNPDRLSGCGLVIANPPYALEAELRALLPALSRRLARGAGSWRLDGSAPPDTERGSPGAKRRTRTRA
jgi:23S rRNA (adenine2030-N6)-methyltransferase